MFGKPELSIYCCGRLTREPTSNGFQNRCLKAHCNLKQVVKKATRGNNILDLIFTNFADFYQIPCILAPLSTSDHCIVIWKPRDSLNNLNKYCLDNSTEYVNSLRHENASLKDENRALKVLYSPYVNKAFVYIFVSKILSFIRQLFIFSSF